LQVLKAIIKDEDIHPKAFHRQHPRGIAIPPHHHGDPGQMLGQENRLIAGDFGRDEAPGPIRDDGHGFPASSAITATQHADMIPMLA
jgi:hypothetical protein